MKKETTKNEKKRYLDPSTKKFIKGNPGGGRKPDTPEQKIVKKSVKKFLKDYEKGLLEKLPLLSPKLVEEAKKGNMQAFDQIHKIVGAYKKDEGNTIVPIQINFNNDKNEYE